MVRPPLFSEVARRHQLTDCEWADPELTRRRYSDRLLVLGLSVDPFREFHFQSAVETASSGDWRLFALAHLNCFTLVAVGDWELPRWSLLPVLASDALLLDFARRIHLTRSQLEDQTQ